MMLVALLAACAGTSPGKGKAASTGTVEALDVVLIDQDYWAAGLDEPGMVVVACTTSSGRVEYGPSESIDVGWFEGDLLVVGDAGAYVECSAWLVR